jgi:hypothetical protein
MYVEQQYIADLDGCDFYHAMDLPGVGEVNGRWDLRPTIDTYLGNVSFVGKRVLDVGAASGYLTFEMERRGGDVVSFDMAGVNDWEIVPFANPDYDIDAVRDTYEKWVKGAPRLLIGSPIACSNPEPKRITATSTGYPKA